MRQKTFLWRTLLTEVYPTKHITKSETKNLSIGFVELPSICRLTTYFRGSNIVKCLVRYFCKYLTKNNSRASKYVDLVQMRRYTDVGPQKL